jgi:multidrug efflux pump subunit AcrB
MMKIIFFLAKFKYKSLMDTGAIAIKITTDANLPITKTQEVMEQINKLMYDHDREKLLRVSGSIGSEAGVMSIGRYDVKLS